VDGCNHIVCRCGHRFWYACSIVAASVFTSISPSVSRSSSSPRAGHSHRPRFPIVCIWLRRWMDVTTSFVGVGIDFGMFMLCTPQARSHCSCQRIYVNIPICIQVFIFATCRAFASAALATSSNCLYLVEKVDGCNHIVCRCGHRFWYVHVVHALPIPPAPL
jgi:hypothetical protein